LQAQWSNYVHNVTDTYSGQNTFIMRQIYKLYISVEDIHLKSLYGKDCDIAQPYKLFASTYIKNEDSVEESYSDKYLLFAFVYL